MTLAPVAISGSLQTSALNRRSADGKTEFTLQQLANVGLESYLWQPWFAIVEGDVSVAFDKSFGDDSGSALLGSASTTLSVLPRSNYPVTLNLEHIDSRVSGEFGASDYIRDRASLNTWATFSQNLRGGLSASWDRTDRENSGLLNSQTVNLNLTQTFSQEDAFLGVNSIGFGAEFSRSDFVADDPEDDDRQRDTATLRLDIRGEPFEDVFFDSLYTAAYDDLDEESDTRARIALQGVSTLQWRPDDEPFIVTGTLRTLAEQIEREDGSEQLDTDTILAVGTLGLRWPVNDRLSFNLGLRGSYEDVNRDEGGTLGENAILEGQRFDATVIAGVNYFSEERDFSGFDWHWDARAQTENGLRSDEGMVSRESITLGHQFDRLLESFIFVPVRFSFAQNADLRFDTEDDDPITFEISNSITFDYSNSEAATSTSARLFLSDSRDLIGEQREFQRVQARLGRRVAISRDRRLQGDLSAQAAREVRDSDTDVFATVFGNLNYTHRNLFDIDNLGLLSELQITVVNLDQLFSESSDELSEEFLRNGWRNILTYRIGRLTTSLEASVFQRDAGLGYLALIRLRRDFGGGA